MLGAATALMAVASAPAVASQIQWLHEESFKRAW
jgi:hypothetical protein